MSDEENIEVKDEVPDEKLSVVATDFIKITDAETGAEITSKRG